MRPGGRGLLLIWSALVVGLSPAGCERPEPGSGLPELTCSSCHGSQANPAPPADLAGNQDPSALGVGAHQLHLVGGRIRGPLACEECHRVPAAIDSPGHGNGLPAELVFGPLARTGGASPTWDRTRGRCAGTYCHGGVWPGGAHPEPLWTLVDGHQTSCQGCHGHPPPAPHPRGSDCLRCHPDTLTAGGEIDLVKGRHLNGRVDLAGQRRRAAAWPRARRQPELTALGRVAPARKGARGK